MAMCFRLGWQRIVPLPVRASWLRLWSTTRRDSRRRCGGILTRRESSRELGIELKHVAAELITTLLSNTEEYHVTPGPCSRGTMSVQLLGPNPRRGLLAHVPEMVKPERPKLAEEVMQVLYIMFASSKREGNDFTLLFPKSVMAPIVTALVEYVEANAQGSAHAAQML